MRFSVMPTSSNTPDKSNLSPFLIIFIFPFPISTYIRNTIAIQFPLPSLQFSGQIPPPLDSRFPVLLDHIYEYIAIKAEAACHHGLPNGNRTYLHGGGKP
ncbi:hypothetical protein U2A404210044 [Corynebacterium striatum]|nr:hypothetical protein U2A404210044 [Corynebacterium striatum]